MNLFDQLHQAIVADSPQVQMLLRQNPAIIHDTSSTNHAPLIHTAAAWGRDEIVEQLLAAGADVNLVCPPDVEGAYRNTPVDLALLHRHSSTTQLLLDRGAERSFFTSVGLNDMEAVRNTVAAHPEKLREERFFPGCLPIHFAAAVSSNAMIELLCELGTDVNARDARGRSPMHYACIYFRGILVLQTLSVHGAELNMTSNDGTTPLLAVCSHYETLPAARWLLEHGADPNLTTTDRKSPLLVAVEHHVPQAVELLVAHGGDVEYRGADGLNALELAQQKKYSEIEQQLTRAGQRH